MLSLLWAIYWLWPNQPQQPDFTFNVHTTATAVFDGPSGDMRPEMVRYRSQYFYSAKGNRLSARDVIQDARDPRNIDSPSFQAWFFLDGDASVGDFILATEKLWAVCETAITIATPTQTEWAIIERKNGKKRCDPIFDEKVSPTIGSR